MLKLIKLVVGCTTLAFFTLHFCRYHLLSSTRVCLDRDWAVNDRDREFLSW